MEEVLALDSADPAPGVNARCAGLRAKVLTNVGMLAVYQGDLDEAERAERDGLRLPREATDIDGRARSLMYLGRIAALR
jgi:hypothetical protein